MLLENFNNIFNYNRNVMVISMQVKATNLTTSTVRRIPKCPRADIPIILAVEN